jgi:hypothetical protein
MRKSTPSHADRFGVGGLFLRNLCTIQNGCATAYCDGRDSALPKRDWRRSSLPESS